MQPINASKVDAIGKFKFMNERQKFIVYTYNHYIIEYNFIPVIIGSNNNN